ncbi:hypothetical protein CBS101457_005108 [Exobasidium rhododendri]|nr:hypothetical protein CBS101457_005108 [Exobasidium rhododendri]
MPPQTCRSSTLVSYTVVAFLLINLFIGPCLGAPAHDVMKQLDSGPATDAIDPPVISNRPYKRFTNRLIHLVGHPDIPHPPPFRHHSLEEEGFAKADTEDSSMEAIELGARSSPAKGAEDDKPAKSATLNIIEFVKRWTYPLVHALCHPDKVTNAKLAAPAKAAPKREPVSATPKSKAAPVKLKMWDPYKKIKAEESKLHPHLNSHDKNSQSRVHRKEDQSKARLIKRWTYEVISAVGHSGDDGGKKKTKSDEQVKTPAPASPPASTPPVKSRPITIVKSKPFSSSLSDEDSYHINTSQDEEEEENIIVMKLEAELEEHAMKRLVLPASPL